MVVDVVHTSEGRPASVAELVVGILVVDVLKAELVVVFNVLVGKELESEIGGVVVELFVAMILKVLNRFFRIYVSIYLIEIMSEPGPQIKSNNKLGRES